MMGPKYRAAAQLQILQLAAEAELLRLAAAACSCTPTQLFILAAVTLRIVSVLTRVRTDTFRCVTGAKMKSW